MSKLRGLSVGMAVLLLSAVPVSAVENAFGSPERQQNMIAGICQTQLTIGEAGCLCLAERAIVGLNDAQRDYLILTVVQPPAAEQSPMARSQSDLRAIATFIDTARQECAAAAPGAPATEPRTERQGPTPEEEAPAQ